MHTLGGLIVRALRVGPVRLAGSALLLAAALAAGIPAARRRGLGRRRTAAVAADAEPVAPPIVAPPVVAPQAVAAASEPEGAGGRTFAGLPVGALYHRDYRFYWFGTGCWVFGEFFRYLAQAWLIFDLTENAFYLGLVSALGALPTVLLAPIAGVLADRLDRRRILMTAQTITGSIMFGTGVLIISGQVQPWHLFAVALATGVFQALDEPARQSLVPSLVPRSELPSAISMGTSLWSIGQVASPGVAGLIIAYVGAGPCFLVTAAGFWGSVLMLAFVRSRPAARTEERHGAMQEMLAGFQYIRQNRVLISLLSISLAIGAFGYAAFILAPVFAIDVLGVGAVGLGVMEAVAGVGGLVGTLIAARLGFHRRRGPILVVAATLFGCLLVAFGYSRYFPLTLVIMTGIGFFDAVFINLALTVGQLSLPDDLRGRIMGIWGLTWFMPPFGGMLGGVLSGAIGAPSTVAVFGAIVATMALVVGAPGVRPLSKPPQAREVVAAT